MPTRNESENIKLLLERIEQETIDFPIEVIFVDDSTDETPDLIRKLQDQFPFKIGLIARPLEQRGNGLGGAVIEGFRAARAPLACVMDADLQHSPASIRELYKQYKSTSSDIVVGSRLARGGDAKSLGFRRMLVSRTLSFLSRAMFPMRLGRVSDPFKWSLPYKACSYKFGLLAARWLQNPAWRFSHSSLHCLCLKSR